MARALGLQQIDQFLGQYNSPLFDLHLNSTDNKGKIPQIQILRYMGNKRGLLKWLIPILKDELNSGDTILDLFAGTSSVGYALKDYAKVIANDIQLYSAIISSSLLEFSGHVTLSDYKLDLSVNYAKNRAALLKIYGHAIEDENNLISKRNVRDYLAFCQKIPILGYPVKNDLYKVNTFVSSDSLLKYRNNHKLFPYNLFITYFPNTYFGLNQCITIDSLKYAIDQINDRKRKAVYLTCLMYAISKAVNSSGHFAQYLRHNSHKNSLEIIEQRKVSIIDRFLQKLT